MELPGYDVQADDYECTTLNGRLTVSFSLLTDNLSDGSEGTARFTRHGHAPAVHRWRPVSWLQLPRRSRK